MRVDNCLYALNKNGFWQCTLSGWVRRKKTARPPRGLCPICSEKKLTPEQLAQREAARAEQEKQAATGAGTQLHKLIKKLTGEKITASCGCKSHIAMMNKNGPAWCRENVDTIVGWLEEEIERRLEEDKPGWRLKLAGYKLPGQRLAIKRVILLACTLAERAEKCQTHKI